MALRMNMCVGSFVKQTGRNGFVDESNDCHVISILRI